VKHTLRGRIQGALASAALALGCAPSEADPEWCELARGFTPAPMEEIAALLGSGAAVRQSVEDGLLWLHWDFAAAAWTRVGGELARASMLLPRGGLAEHVDFRRLRLRDGKRDFDKAPGRRPDRAFAPPPWSYFVEGERLTLYAPADSKLPDPLTFSAAMDQGRDVAGVWHVDSGNITGAGIPLWPERTEEITCDVPQRARLRLLAKLPAGPRPGTPAQLEILWNGRSLEAFALAETDETGTWIQLDLPDEGGTGVRLGLCLRGAPGMAVAYEPTLGPRNIGMPGNRPWGGRPDVVVFLTDTFRADNLTAYGGAKRTPHLDRWVERSLRFRDARSTATWTLPALSSLFTAAYPPQHGAVGPSHSLSEDFHTLSEHLRDYGYRTVAVTDSFFASRRYGLAQGFSWFREIPTADWKLQSTLDEASAALGRDDGRPVFLFVHTYRVHKPFRVGKEEDRSAFDALVKEVEAQAGGTKPTADLSREYRARAPRFAELYAEGVRDLDRRLATWLEGLETRGILNDGMCLITSDHGESFDEHGDMFHRLPPWEEQIRVPLVLLGERIPAREALGNASLIDVPRTIAQYCGLPEPESWGGRALLREGAGDLAFAFQMGPNAERYSRMALVKDQRKLFLVFDSKAPRTSELRFAYNLSDDPDEKDNQADEGWAQATREELLPILEALARRRFEPGSVQIGSEERAGLEELGYAGDDPP